MILDHVKDSHSSNVMNETHKSTSHVVHNTSFQSASTSANDSVAVFAAIDALFAHLGDASHDDSLGEHNHPKKQVWWSRFFALDAHIFIAHFNY